MKTTLAFPLEITREQRPVTAGIAFSFESNYPALLVSRSSFLHANEEKRFNEMKFPRRQKSFLLGRAAAKGACGFCCQGVEAAKIEIASGVFNQPYVNLARTAPPEVSLAHAGEVAVAVACEAGHPIGVDLEPGDAERGETAKACCGEDEMRFLEALNPRGTDPFCLLWTIKEALSKVLRCGLTAPFETLAVASTVEGENGLYESLFLHFQQYKANSWILGDYLLSIVLPRRSSLRFNPGSLIPDMALFRSRLKLGEPPV